MTEIEYLFDSSGNWIAFRKATNVFLPSGEWIGWTPEGRGRVVDLKGQYLGTVVGDHRPLRDIYSYGEEASATPGYPGREAPPENPLYPERYDLPTTMEDVGLLQNA